MTSHSTEHLLNADPVGLTVREMLLRIDAKVDDNSKRIRTLEDDSLVAKTERKTLRNIAVSALAVWPVVGFILVNVVHIS